LGYLINSVILKLLICIIFSESNDISIPKLGDQKFATLAELLEEQGDYRINVSQSSKLQLKTTINTHP